MSHRMLHNELDRLHQPNQLGTLQTGQVLLIRISTYEPSLLPRPPPKREPANPKVSDLNPHDGPVVLSPPRKSRRVMPHREGFEANVLSQSLGRNHLLDRPLTG